MPPRQYKSGHRKVAHRKLPFDHQVEEIRHKAKRLHVPAGLFANLAEGLLESETVAVILKNVLAPIAPIHDARPP